MAKTLCLAEVSVCFGDRILLERVNICVKRGEITALVGHSGSGKTLCALSLQGLLPQNLKLTNGEILLDGEPLVMGRHRGLISGIMQAPRTCFNPLYTMKTHIRESLAAVQKSYDTRRILGLFQRLGLSESVLECYAYELSGGMLQRVMIAIALVCEAEFLIADEPTSDLDSINAREIIALLQEVSREFAVGVLLITHDTRLLPMASTRYRMDSGKCKLESNVLIAQNTSTLKDSTARAATLATFPSIVSAPVATTLHHSTPQHTTPMLEISNLHKRYGKTLVLDSVSLTLYRGEKLAIIGRSGCGKSTLARLIVQLEPYTPYINEQKEKKQCAKNTHSPILVPSHWLECSNIRSKNTQQHEKIARDDWGEGREKREKSERFADCVRSDWSNFNDNAHKSSMESASHISLVPSSLSSPPLRLSLQVRRRFYRHIQLLFQDALSALNPRLSVWENLTQGLAILANVRDKERQKQILLPLFARLSLDVSLLYTYPSMLSIGQAARINLIKSLCIDPELIILDETTSALNSELEERLWRDLVEAVDSGSFCDIDTDISANSDEKSIKSLIFITHNIAFARRYCDRIALMDSGRIVEVVRSDEPFSSELGIILDGSL